MADWPSKEELLRVIDVEALDSDDPLDTVLDRVLAAGITRVKNDVGDWDDATDYPDDNEAQAALVAAEHYSLRPEAAGGAIADPRYASLMSGHRRRFGFS